MGGGRCAISLFGSRATTEYFSCAQFDRVARIVGVWRKAPYRYCLRSSLANKALTNYRARVIQFDKKWFLGLSPEARCAVLVHELWHVTLLKRTSRAKWFRRLYLYVAVPTLSFLLVWALLIVASAIAPGEGNLPDVLVLLFPVFAFLGFLYGNRLWRWSFEYQCDEAAVRFIGAAPTSEFLKTFKLKSMWRDHPPTRRRLERVDEEASKHPVPMVDFSSLQREVRQEFLFD